jgi:hypothetical protein
MHNGRFPVSVISSGRMSDQLQGFVLIADISGYTAYLNESELEHAKGTLTELLELMIEHTRPPLVINRLEGDAVISYGIESDFPSGQAFVESIEDTYVAFRKAIELMVLNNTCQCNACANVSSLDLKFFVHYGSFLLQRLGDSDELLGSDIIVIHRLLKNTVVADTGISAYCLYTEPALEALGIGGFAGLTRHRESVTDFGDIDVWVQDMHVVYEARRDASRIDIGKDEILFEVESDIALGTDAVWSYLIQPEYRSLLLGSDRQEIVGRKDGRVGVGSTYECFHGKTVLPQVVMEWQPFQRVVTQDLMGGPFKGSVLADYRLEATETGTRLRRASARIVGGPITSTFMRLLTPMMRKKMKGHLDDFRDRVEADWEESAAGDAAAPQITSETIAAAAAASFVSNRE